jgi:hypothetical protein
MPDRHAPYHMLLDAFSQDGCPICTLIEHTVVRYLDMLIHEHVNDIDFRNELRQAGGFCNRHAWLFITTIRGAAVGAAIMYRDVLNTYRQRLQHGSVSQKGLGPLRRRPSVSFLLPGQSAAEADCPACQIAERDESLFVGAFASHCEEWRFVEGYAASAGLCRPHFEKALGRCSSPVAARSLLDAQVKLISLVVADLDRFLEKSDYRAVEEPTTQEGRSWQRAIELATGKEGLT